MVFLITFFEVDTENNLFAKASGEREKSALLYQRSSLLNNRTTNCKNSRKSSRATKYSHFELNGIVLEEKKVP